MENFSSPYKCHAQGLSPKGNFIQQKIYKGTLKNDSDSMISKMIKKIENNVDF